MSYCWYCYWGWGKPVVDIYAEAVRRLNGDRDPLHFGPSHVVWEDENFDCAQICLDSMNKSPDTDYTEEQLAVVRWSLEELQKLPENVREPEPQAYADADDSPNENFPAEYPPAAGLVMIHMSYNTPLPGELHELQEN